MLAMASRMPLARKSLQEGLQAQEMAALARRIEIDPVITVVADAAAPERIVEIDNDELAARRDDADDGVGQHAEQSRCPVRMERNLAVS